MPGGDSAAARRFPGLKVSLLALVAVGLIGLLGVGLTSGAATSSAPAGPRRALPTRPALTREEQAFVQALWPIHGEVERSAIRLSLGQILYKTGDLDRVELKTRADQALATYRRAEISLHALQPPSSLQGAHTDYLAAVGLFEDSAIELLKMFDDGREEHLIAAYPLGLEGTNKIREIGGRFWPEEFPPN
jgi:hypothetical protein